MWLTVYWSVRKTLWLAHVKVRSLCLVVGKSGSGEVGWWGSWVKGRVAILCGSRCTGQGSSHCRWPVQR